MRSLHSETHLVSRIGWLRRSEDMLRCGANTGNRIGTRRSLGSEIMTYTLDKTIKGLPFDDVVAAAKVALATKGFGLQSKYGARGDEDRTQGRCHAALQCDRATAGERDHHGQRHRSRRLDAGDRQSAPQDSRRTGAVRRRRDLRHRFPGAAAGCLSDS